MFTLPQHSERALIPTAGDYETLRIESAKRKLYTDHQFVHEPSCFYPEMGVEVFNVFKSSKAFDVCEDNTMEQVQCVLG